MVQAVRLSASASDRRLFRESPEFKGRSGGLRPKARRPPHEEGHVLDLSRDPGPVLAILLVWMALVAGTQVFAQDARSPAQNRIASLFKQAREAEQTRNFAEATKLYDEVLKIDPGVAEVWTNRGLCLYELNRHREAVSSFAKAATLKPQLLVPHLFLGIEYLKLDQPQKAVSSLQSALSIDPNHLQASYELANAYVRLEQFQQAVDLYGELLRRNPQMEEAWYRLGIGYLNWSRMAARQLVDSAEACAYGKVLLADLQAVAGLRQAAEANFRAAVTTQPDLGEARLALGQFYLDSQAPEQMSAAHEQLARAKELNSEDLQVEIALTRLDLLQGDFVRAVRRLGTVLRVDFPFVRKHIPELAMGFTPDRLKEVITAVTGVENDTPTGRDSLVRASAQAILYSANQELGTKEPAERTLREFEGLATAQQLSPLEGSYSRRLQELQRRQQVRRLSAAESLDLAVFAWNLGEYDRALDSLLAVLGQEADRRALYWLYRTCHALARETFQTAIAKNPESYRAHLLLGDLANLSHDTVGAASEYEKAVLIGKTDPEVHLVFVQFLTAKSRIPEALEEARVAVERFPAHPALNREFGKLLLRTGNAQQAIVHLQRSLEADSNFVEVRAELADAYAASGDFGKAINTMNKALAADKDGSFHYRVGRWYQIVGQTSEANVAFAVANKLKETRRETERSKLIPFEPRGPQP
jgi:predicted Zn-dependent protease